MHKVSVGARPTDGYFVNFLRLLFRYPEILAWEKLWMDSKHSIRKEIYGAVKALDSTKRVGWHIWHRGRGFCPFNRALIDYADYKKVSDFIHPTVFSNPAGIRFRERALCLQGTIFADLKPEDVATILYPILGYKNEGSLDEIPSKGFSPEYVYREIKMAVEQLQGEVAVYAGIAAATYYDRTRLEKTAPGPSYWKGITGKIATPEDVKADIKAAIQAGADGLIIGSVNIKDLGPAVGEVLEEIGWC